MCVSIRSILIKQRERAINSLTLSLLRSSSNSWGFCEWARAFARVNVCVPKIDWIQFLLDNECQTHRNMTASFGWLYQKIGGRERGKISSLCTGLCAEPPTRKESFKFNFSFPSFSFDFVCYTRFRFFLSSLYFAPISSEVQRWCEMELRWWMLSSLTLTVLPANGNSI